MTAAATGTLAAVVLLGFTVLGRLIYRIDRDLSAIRERLARIEGRHQEGSEHEHLD